jgi:hypothetical protein
MFSVCYVIFLRMRSFLQKFEFFRTIDADIFCLNRPKGCKTHFNNIIQLIGLFNDINSSPQRTLHSIQEVDVRFSL